MKIANILVGISILFVFITMCSVLKANQSDIKEFDQDYLTDKYIGKVGWAKVDLGGIKAGDKLVVDDIEFGPRTIVKVKSKNTDYSFIIYSNKKLGVNERENEEEKPIDYDIRQIEKQITDRISFIDISKKKP